MRTRSRVFHHALANTAVPFGTLIDRHHKHRIMVASALGSVVLLMLAAGVYALTPDGDLARSDSPWFWVFAALVLGSALLANIRGLALATLVTMLISSKRRANANGLVGAVNGPTMLVTSVLSGLAVGQLGMGAVLVISVVVIVASLGHLLALRIPETVVVAAEGTP